MKSIIKFLFTVLCISTINVFAQAPIWTATPSCISDNTTSGSYCYTINPNGNTITGWTVLGDLVLISGGAQVVQSV